MNRLIIVSIEGLLPGDPVTIHVPVEEGADLTTAAIGKELGGLIGDALEDCLPTLAARARG